ncbi:MAG: DUF2911 domain-containing protein [Longimicrobiales bacterium]
MHAGIRIPLLTACLLGAGQLSAQSNPDDAAFVTRLGVDTIAVERFIVQPNGIRAEVLLRAPELALRVYELELANGQQPARLTVESYDPRRGLVGEPSSREVLTLDESVGIPFIDMVHWPFELMLRQAAEAGEDSITFALATARRPLPFVVARVGPGRYTATHPSRGTMDVEVDAQGRLLSLDASKTTRALRVTREPSADIGGLAARFAARGGAVGELSGRGAAEAVVNGAQISVDYGQPLKRGRDIFGALVPWDRVWRTGANRATHFTTSRDLRVGETVIPAGTYTLFTIPRSHRWTLLVNRRTDINGQAYDAEHDLARLEMQTRTLEETTEPFTILVEESEDGAGVLRLRWDRTEAYLPFRVVN